MRLVFDARFWRHETGGIGRYSRELFKELLLLKTDDEFHVVLTPKDATEFLIKDKRVTPHVVEIGHYSYAEQFQLPRVLKSLKPDLVHFLNFNQPLFYAGRRVTTIHDLTVKYFPVGRSQADPIRRVAFNAIMRRAATSDGVIAISRSTKSDIVRDLKVDPTTIRVIGEAADSQFAPQSAATLKAFRVRAKLSRPYILFVNQWRPHKGLPELIQAFEQLKTVHKLPHQLVITGKASPHFPEIQQLINQSPARVDILTPGFVSDADLPSYYAAAEVVAFPSYYEGFGLGILEAMQSGTPVVCSEISSLPEVAGDAALFVEPRNVEQLTQSLRVVLIKPALAAELRARGLKQAARFSWHETAKQTYALYQKIIGGSN
jgi:alpha-1,3-rhamnosyl/mannosyltransferase